MTNRAVSRSGGILRSANGDEALFERLPQHLQGPLADLGELVEEQHATLRASNLAGADLGAADQPSLRDCVARRTEWPVIIRL